MPTGIVATKRLHSQDLDFYVTLRPRAAWPYHPLSASRRPGEALPEITTAFDPIPAGKAGPGVIAAMPNDTWQNAQPFEFGQTIYGASDERPYSPAADEDRYAALLKGFQWFRFTFHGDQPKLAYFVLDITDREVPVDVDVFTLNQNTRRPFGRQSHTRTAHRSIRSKRLKIIRAFTSSERAFCNRNRLTTFALLPITLLTSYARLHIPYRRITILSKPFARAWISSSIWVTAGYRILLGAALLPCGIR